MKIHIDNVELSSTSGPNTFASRLAKSLFQAGHDVTVDGSTADVSLVFIEPSGGRLARTVVQRLDGIWFKPEEFETKNVGIKRLYDRAHAVVFQSRFDKDMIEHWWEPNDARSRLAPIINNGIDLVRVNEVTIAPLQRLRSTYEKVFVSSANWHPQKRLKANIGLFNHLRSTLFSNSCLIVMGSNNERMVADPHVYYIGSQPHDVCLQVFAVADWLLHLAWADHCPNVVVEALGQGTPVVCSEVGGTKELIAHGAYGMVLKEKQPYGFELTDYDNPPDIDVRQVTFLPTRHELDYGAIPNINIADVAKQYIELFERLL